MSGKNIRSTRINSRYPSALRPAIISRGCRALSRIRADGSPPSDTINPPPSGTPAAAAKAVIEPDPGLRAAFDTGIMLRDDPAEPGERGKKVRVAQNPEYRKAVFCHRCNTCCIALKAFPDLAFVIRHREIENNAVPVRCDEVCCDPSGNKDRIRFL